MLSCQNCCRCAPLMWLNKALELLPIFVAAPCASRSAPDPSNTAFLNRPWNHSRDVNIYYDIYGKCAGWKLVATPPLRYKEAGERQLFAFRIHAAGYCSFLELNCAGPWYHTMSPSSSTNLQRENEFHSATVIGVGSSRWYLPTTGRIASVASRAW